MLSGRSVGCVFRVENYGQWITAESAGQSATQGVQSVKKPLHVGRARGKYYFISTLKTTGTVSWVWPSCINGQFVHGCRLERAPQPGLVAAGAWRGPVRDWGVVERRGPQVWAGESRTNTGPSGICHGPRGRCGPTINAKNASSYNYRLGVLSTAIAWLFIILKLWHQYSHGVVGQFTANTSNKYQTLAAKFGGQFIWFTTMFRPSSQHYKKHDWSFREKFFNNLPSNTKVKRL